MTRRPTTGAKAGTDAPRDARPEGEAGGSLLRLRGTSSSGLAQRRHTPRSREEVEERYIAARDAWTAAMKAANSGRAADLAALAIAQDAYETAAAERQRWDSGARVAIPIQPETSHRDLGAVVGHELAWRQMRHVEEKPNGLLGRLRKRLGGG